LKCRRFYPRLQHLSFEVALPPVPQISALKGRGFSRADKSKKYAGFSPEVFFAVIL
jgi:hypothetical protein